MAETKKENTAVKTDAVRDRVAMLSLSKDGTPDQTNPEIIGDKDFALDAAKRQFAEQAVSAVDDREREAGTGGEELKRQDPSIEALKKQHDAAEKAAESAAERVVNGLYEGDDK